MKIDEVVKWMLINLEKDFCLYQDDVVDYLVKHDQMDFLKENVDGNLVIASKVLIAFKNATLQSVVWVKPDRYWRYRVPEDELGREARG